MRRAVHFYLLMIFALIGGLWIMVRVGGQMHAPPDISGTWQIDSPGAEPVLGPMMRVQQSGKYFHLSFDKGPAFDVTLRAEAQNGSPMRFTLDLSNASSTISLVANGAHGHLTGTIHGVLEESFSAKWIGKESVVKPSAQKLAAAEHSPLHRLLDSPIGLLIAQVLVGAGAEPADGTCFLRDSTSRRSSAR